MLKKIGLPILALAAMLVLIPAPKASAAVRFGVYVGGPVYAYPAYPYPAPPPYYNAYPPYPAYEYPAPAYVYPYAYWGGYWRGHDRHEYYEHRDRGWHGHEWRNHEGRGRGRR